MNGESFRYKFIIVKSNFVRLEKKSKCQYNFVLLFFIKKSSKLLRKKEFYDIRYNRYSVSARMENEYE